jgi:hypothetical protein
MRIIPSTVLTLIQKQSLFELWNSEYPEKICYSEMAEFENYLEILSNQKHYLLINDINQILGWAFTFVREVDNWFAIIVNSNIHRKGFGSLLLKELKKNSFVLNGWVIDHQNEIKQNKEPYLSPIEFYFKNGFVLVENARLENETISAIKIKWEKE